MGAAYKALDDVLRKWKYRPEPGHTGSYNCRKITGGTNYSLHAYLDGTLFTFWSGVRISMALAVDINWQRNPYGPKLITDMPRGMVDEICAIRTAGGVPVWGWGGYYSGNKDAMHFELLCTPAELSAGIRKPKPIDIITPPVQEDDMPNPAMIEHCDGNLVVVYACKDGLAATWRDGSKPDLPWSEPVRFGEGAGKVAGLSLIQERERDGRKGNLVVTAVAGGRVLLWWRDETSGVWTGPAPVASGAV